MKNKENKYVLVTGASSGLGKETVKKLAQEGYKVFATVRKESDKNPLQCLNDNICCVVMDVTNQESIDKVYNYISEKTDFLYAIVNNAGIALAGPIEFLPVEVLQKQIDVNVYGPLRVAQKFLPLMKNTDDFRIVNLSSVASFGVFPFISPYCVSKKMLDMFFNAFLIESKMKNLKIISIKPGVVATPIWNTSINASKQNYEFLSEEAKQKYKNEFEMLAENAEKNTYRGIKPKVVADVISKVLRIKNPKLSYTIGMDSKLAGLFSKLPQAWVNFLIKQKLAQKIK